MGAEEHEKNRIRFAIALFLIQVVIIVLFSNFVKPKDHIYDGENTYFYPIYQDINVMILIGFGFLMTFIKDHSWSALLYTFFINAIVIQLYLLLERFWFDVFKGDFGGNITIVQNSFIPASYSVAAVLISFGAVIGRVGPLQLLIMGIVQIIGYTLNEAILYKFVKIFDFGGSIIIHTFGAYFGLTVSLILSKKVAPQTKPQKKCNSNIFAIIGTFFLWMFWPSFNVGYSVNPYQKSLIIINTYLALCGSCTATFIITTFKGKKISMEDIIDSTLAGGVIIGASCQVIYNPAGSLCVGILGGIVTSLGNKYLQIKLQEKIGLHDTRGVHNLHGIPGVLGGIISAIAIAYYAQNAFPDKQQQKYLSFYARPETGLNYYGKTFNQQGGNQFLGIFVSMGIAIFFGIIAALLIWPIYNFEPSQFYKDDIYFDVPLEDQKDKLLPKNE